MRNCALIHPLHLELETADTLYVAGLPDVGRVHK